MSEDGLQLVELGGRGRMRVAAVEDGWRIAVMTGGEWVTLKTFAERDEAERMLSRMGGRLNMGARRPRQRPEDVAHALSAGAEQ